MSNIFEIKLTDNVVLRARVRLVSAPPLGIGGKSKTTEALEFSVTPEGGSTVNVDADQVQALLAMAAATRNASPTG